MTNLKTHSQTRAAGLSLRLVLAAPPSSAFDAIATRHGIAAWWTPLVRGRVAEGREFALGFAGLDENIRIRVGRSVRPKLVHWTIIEHLGAPEWNGTRVRFDLSASASNKTTLKFCHEGLLPGLACYSDCRAGWGHFLKSLADVAAGRKGQPYTG